MKDFWIIYKRELLSFFRTPVAAIFVVAFHLTAMIYVFFLDGWLDHDQADLLPFFSALPWLMLVLVPGIAMRSWAEEHSCRSLELTLTLPFHELTLILGKFTAAWTILGLSLALSFPLPLTAAYLGSPDSGALLCGYLGGFLMAGSLLALAHLCSLLSRQPIISYVLSASLTLGLLLLGWGVAGDFLKAFLPIGLVEAVASQAIIPHYEALARGLIQLQDLGYFLLLIGSSLLAAYQQLIWRRTRSRRFSRRGLAVIAGLLALFAGNSQLSSRLDLSENKAYSISEASLALARDIKQPTEAVLFFSRGLPQASPFMKQYHERVRAVLQRYAKAADGRLQVKTLDPKADTPEEDQALAFGIRAWPGPEGAFYFGIGFRAEDQSSAVPFLDPAREDLLEYEIGKALLALQQRSKPRLGIWSSLKLAQAGPDGSRQESALLTALRSSYEIETWDTLPASIPDATALMLIIHPKELNGRDVEAIDRFLMRGGRLMLALDPFARSELIQKYGRPTLELGGTMPTFQSQFDAFLKVWGLNFDTQRVVGDPQRATSITVYGQSLAHPLFMKMGRADMGTAPFIKNLKEILIAEGGSLSLKPESPLTLETLFQTTGAAGEIDSFPLAFQPPSAVVAAFRSGSAAKTVAGLLRGPFPSARDPQLKHMNEVIIVADADFLDDRHTVRTQASGAGFVKQQRNDNINLVLNSLGHLSGSDLLMNIRSSGVISRPFTRLRDLQQRAEFRWREEEQRIQTEIQAAQQQLSTYYGRDAANNRLELRREDLQIIAQLRDQKRDMERRFRRVRLDLREDSSRLFHQLVALNFAAAPLLVLIGSIGLHGIRFRRSLRLRRPPAWALTLVSAAAVGLTLWVSLIQTQQSLHAAPVFETLFRFEDLAAVDRIVLTENGTRATLLKQADGRWRMEEAGGRLVQADRLARLLYDLAETKLVRRLSVAAGPRDAFGLDQGRSLSLEGGFTFKILIGRQLPHGGYVVQVEGQPEPVLVDDFLHTNTSPDFWLVP